MRHLYHLLVSSLLSIGCGSQISTLQRQVTVRIEADVSAETQRALVQTKFLMIQQRYVTEAIRQREIILNEADIIQELFQILTRNVVSQGSGFLVRDEESGEVLAITNRHVVNGSAKVNVLVDEHISINECNVRFVDNVMDLAVISIPDSPITQYLDAARLSDRSAVDNDAVQATGYPRIRHEGGSSQTYRNTAGKVSNSSFMVPVDGREESVIQHTAPIDHGNSGGPLFLEHSLDVIGVNTSGMESSPNLYMAIPASVVSDVIRKAMKRPSEGVIGTEPLLVETCQQFMKEMNVEGNLRDSALDMLTETMALSLWNRMLMNDVDELKVAYRALTLPPSPPCPAGRPRCQPRGWSQPPPAMSDRKVQETVLPLIAQYSSGENDDRLVRQARGVAFNWIRKFFRHHGGANEGWCNGYMAQDLSSYDPEQGVRMGFSVDNRSYSISWLWEQGHWRIRFQTLVDVL